MTLTIHAAAESWTIRPVSDGSAVASCPTVFDGSPLPCKDIADALLLLRRREAVAKAEKDAGRALSFGHVSAILAGVQ